MVCGPMLASSVPSDNLCLSGHVREDLEASYSWHLKGSSSLYRSGVCVPCSEMVPYLFLGCRFLFFRI